MNNEFLHMQKLAGIITEGEYKQLLENEEIINRILEKISSKGINSISPYEKEYLDAYAQEKELPPVEFLDNGTLRDAFFVSGDKEGAVNLKPFLDRVMEDITKATGGFNLFRVAYRDDSNTVIIKDDQYTPKLSGEADSVLDRSSYKANRKYMELQVFGSGSLVRDMEFKTNMSSKMSSMIAISAQSGGQTANSQDATPIGTYNTNYDDAFMTVKLNSLSTGSAITTNTANQQAQEEKEKINTLEQAVKRFNRHVIQVYKNGYVSKVEIPPAVSYYLNRFDAICHKV